MSELKTCPFCEGKLVLSWHGGEDCYLCDCCGIRLSMPQGSIRHLTDIVNHRPSSSNAPLTLDELRQMDGEPVYIVGQLYSGWTVPWRNAAKYIARCPDEANISYYTRDYGKTWLAYRCKPATK